MLAAAGAFQAQGARHQFVVDLLGAGALGRVGGVDQEADVEVAVADVADEEVGDAAGVHVGHGVDDAFGQARDRHAGVGGDHAAARAALHAGEVRVVARGPQARALLGRVGPLEGLAAVLGRQGLHGLGLLAHTGSAAVELHQQHVLLPQAQLVVAVHQADGVAIDQLAARDRHAGLDDVDGGVDGILHAREVADRRQHGLRQRVEAQRHFSDDAQRALAADEQAGQVVTRAGLARSACRCGSPGRRR